MWPALRDCVPIADGGRKRRDPEVHATAFLLPTGGGRDACSRGSRNCIAIVFCFLHTINLWCSVLFCGAAPQNKHTCVGNTEIWQLLSSAVYERNADVKQNKTTLTMWHFMFISLGFSARGFLLSQGWLLFFCDPPLYFPVCSTVICSCVALSGCRAAVALYEAAV